MLKNQCNCLGRVGFGKIVTGFNGLILCQLCLNVYRPGHEQRKALDKQEKLTEPPSGRWMPLGELLAELTPRMGANDGGTFILEHWDWKYANVRIDMRTGMAYVVPGNVPAAPAFK